VNNIIVLSVCLGFTAGSALTYALIKSYRAAVTCAVGALISLGLLVYVLSLKV